MSDVFVGDNDHGDTPLPPLSDLLWEEITKLRQEIVQLNTVIKELKEGFEGCCNACEPVGEMNKKLREERDEARRMWCEAAPVGNSLSVNDMDRRARAEATRRGWDCFKEENTNV